MFCFRIKRKLYDLLEGGLDESRSRKLEIHLEKCPGCARAYQELRQVLELAAQKKNPEPSPEFWQGFDRELAARMGREDSVPVGPAVPVTVRPRLRLRPAFALATVAAVLLIVFNLYLVDKLPGKAWLLARNEEALVNDAAVLEEMTGEVILLEDDDYLLTEFDLLEELS